MADFCCKIFVNAHPPFLASCFSPKEPFWAAPSMRPPSPAQVKQIESIHILSSIDDAHSIFSLIFANSQPTGLQDVFSVCNGHFNAQLTQMLPLPNATGRQQGRCQENPCTLCDSVLLSLSVINAAILFPECVEKVICIMFIVILGAHHDRWTLARVECALRMISSWETSPDARTCHWQEHWSHWLCRISVCIALSAPSQTSVLVERQTTTYDKGTITTVSNSICKNIHQGYHHQLLLQRKESSTVEEVNDKSTQYQSVWASTASTYNKLSWTLSKRKDQVPQHMSRRIPLCRFIQENDKPNITRWLRYW